MGLRTCESCDRGFHQYGRGRPAKRCPDCRSGDRYGAQHRTTRAATVDLAVGQACARCGRVMLAGEAVELDHADDDPARYIGYSHRSCNRASGAARNNAARAAAYRAAKGQPASNGSTGTISAAAEKTPQRSLNREPPPQPRCQRTAAQIDASAAARDPLPCICARRNSRCW